jgi:hypothetical protein
MAAAVVAGVRLDRFEYYDVLGDPLEPAGLLVAIVVAASGAVAAMVVRWQR